MNEYLATQVEEQLTYHSHLLGRLISFPNKASLGTPTSPGQASHSVVAEQYEMDSRDLCFYWLQFGGFLCCFSFGAQFYFVSLIMGSFVAVQRCCCFKKEHSWVNREEGSGRTWRENMINYI